MAGMEDSVRRGVSTKPVWQTPRLAELGSLRAFVQTGHAFGKSGAPSDGSSDPGGESMTM